MRKYLGLIGLFCLLGTGCASKTVLGVGPLRFGGRVELHEMRKPSVTVENNEELRFTIGNLSFGPIATVKDGSQTLLNLDHSTGSASVVDGQ